VAAAINEEGLDHQAVRAVVTSAAQMDEWRTAAEGYLDESWQSWTTRMQQDKKWGDEVAALLACASLAPKRRLFIYNAELQRLVHISWKGQESESVPIVLWFANSHYDAFHIDAGELPDVKEDITDWKASWEGGARDLH
jgi:hypothetical protein